MKEKEIIHKDGRDGRDKKSMLQHRELTATILEAAFEVSNDLGMGFLEGIYEKALCISLQQRGVAIEQQKPIEVNYKGVNIGKFFADFVIENRVVLELKASKDLIPEHEAQLLSYLKATGLPVGMLLNFGQPKLQYRRYIPFSNEF